MREFEQSRPSSPRNFLVSFPKTDLFAQTSSCIQALAGDCFSVTMTNVVYRKKKKRTEYDFYLMRDTLRVSLGCTLMCPLSIEEIDRYLKDINLILLSPIYWEIKDVSDLFGLGINVLKLSVSIDNFYSNLQHLYILTRIRQLTEIPFCFFIRDAIKLIDLYPEKYDSIEQAFCEVLNSADFVPKGHKFFGSSSYTFPGNRCSVFIHDFDITINKPRFLSWQGIETYRTRFKEMNGYNTIFGCLYPSRDFRPMERYKLITENILDMGFWMDDFERRIPIYLNESPDIGEIKSYPKRYLRDWDRADLENLLGQYKTKLVNMDL